MQPKVQSKWWLIRIHGVHLGSHAYFVLLQIIETLCAKARTYGSSRTACIFIVVSTDRVNCDVGGGQSVQIQIQ